VFAIQEINFLSSARYLLLNGNALYRVSFWIDDLYECLIGCVICGFNVMPVMHLGISENRRNSCRIFLL